MKGTWGAISTAGAWAMGRSIDHAAPWPAPRRTRRCSTVSSSRARWGAPSQRASPAALHPPLPGPALGICSDLEPLDLAPDVQRVLDAAHATLAGAGCVLVEVRFPEAELVRSTFTTIRDAETLWTHRAAGLFPQRREEYSEQTYDRLAAALPVGLDEYLAASAVRQRLDEAYDLLFGEVDVLLMPVASATPPRISADADMEAWNHVGAYTVPADLLGVPACAFRAGFDDLGLPVGLQVMGRKRADATVLSVVQLYAEATPELQARWPDAAITKS